MPFLSELSTDAELNAFAARVADSSGDPVPVMLNDGFQTPDDFYAFVVDTPSVSIDLAAVAKELKEAFPEGQTSPPESGPISTTP